MEAPLCISSCKVKKNVYHWITVYIQGSWTLGKSYGIKNRGAIGNVLGNASENLMGTKRKKPKTPFPHLPPKGKNKAHHEFLLSIPIGYIKFLFPKLLVNIVLLPILSRVIYFFPIFHLFLSRLICFGFSFSLTRRGHGKLPSPDLPTPKVYSYNLQNQPKEEITRYPF